MIIWGFRQKILQLAMVTFLCGTCGNPSAHALRRAVNKFTLFFIPLFPISSKYFTQCTFCGATNRLTKEQAEQVLGMSQQTQAPTRQHGGYPQQPQAPVQHSGYPQRPQHGGYPRRPGR